MPVSAQNDTLLKAFCLPDVYPAIRSSSFSSSPIISPSLSFLPCQNGGNFHGAQNIKWRHRDAKEESHPVHVVSTSMLLFRRKRTTLSVICRNSSSLISLQSKSRSSENRSMPWISRRLVPPMSSTLPFIENST